MRAPIDPLPMGTLARHLVSRRLWFQHSSICVVLCRLVPVTWFCSAFTDQIAETFYDELSAVFERLSAYNCPIVICGDFNFHVDRADDVNAVQRLQQLLQSFGCTQHVTEPTHNAGHSLDLVITRNNTEISDLRVGAMISDHALIRFTLRVKKSCVNTQAVTSRAWRRLSLDGFTADLAASPLCSDLAALNDLQTDDLVQLYRVAVTELLDQHCPVVQVRRRARPMTAWFDADCRAARRRARAAERRFKSQRTEANEQRLDVETANDAFPAVNDAFKPLYRISYRYYNKIIILSTMQTNTTQNAKSATSKVQSGLKQWTSGPSTRAPRFDGPHHATNWVNYRSGKRRYICCQEVPYFTAKMR